MPVAVIMRERNCYPPAHASEIRSLPELRRTKQVVLCRAALRYIDPALGEDLQATLDGRARPDGAVPARDVRKIDQALVRHLVDPDPRKAGDVGDRVFVAQKVAIPQPTIQDLEEPPPFACEAIDAVGDGLGCIAVEVLRLSEHRP